MLDGKKLGIRIASLRKGIGYSQERLAEILRISPQAISKWENGHYLPDTSLLPVLAQVFECTIDQIIMPAYSFDETIEKEKPSVIEQQAEHIAKYVIHKMEGRFMQKEIIGLSDDTIAEAVIKKHNLIGNITIQRGKTSRSEGKICTNIDIIALHEIIAPRKEIKLLETVYHKRDEEFYGYSLFSEYITELPQIYCIDYDKKAILFEDLSDSYIKGYDFNEDNENGMIIRENYSTILRAVANCHSAFWENGNAFKRIGLMNHLETKENMLAWINNAMERPFKKYRNDEESGKIPKDSGVCGKNTITIQQLNCFNEALQYLKTEYVKLIDSRFNAGKNITILCGDLHPGHIQMSKSSDRKVTFTGLQAVRMGLCTEDLAMLVALHIAMDKKDGDISRLNKNDVTPLLDYYYQCLSETVRDYPYETFINDYKLSVAENMFFPVRLINRGIYDFRMRDKAIRAFETFVLGSES